MTTVDIRLPSCRRTVLYTNDTKYTRVVLLSTENENIHGQDRIDVFEQQNINDLPSKRSFPSAF